MLPGIERQPRKKLEPSPEWLLGLLHGWRDEAVKAGRKITRIRDELAVAEEQWLTLEMLREEIDDVERNS